MTTTESYNEWSRRVYKGTQFEHIGYEVETIRSTRYEKREKRRATQKTIFFRVGHFLGLPGFEYKERQTENKRGLNER